MQDSYILSDLRQADKNIKQKQIHLTPIVIGQINTASSEKPHMHQVKILLDTGTSSTIIISKYTKNKSRNKS